MQTVREIPLRKIDDYRWEIPMDYDPGMRVPGLVFCDEKLLQTLRKDQALQQVANVAHLPGIVGHSLAMPDIHWGYGFPIGGVAATDPDQGGVISPGGIGFDINCLSGEAEILHQYGYTRKIEDIVSRQIRDRVSSYDLERQAVGDSEILIWKRSRPSAPVFELKTVSGRKIVATAEHPFLAPDGMKVLSDLKVGDQVALSPFQGVPYEEPPKEVLVDEDSVHDFMLAQGKGSGNAVAQVLNSLLARGLLPLRYDSPILPVLIKALGYVTGDGSLYFVGKKGKGITAFYGKPEDLEDIRADLSRWWRVSRLYGRKRSHRIETDYGQVNFEATEHYFRVNSTSFAVLLALLGCPLGNKSIQDYEVPRWLKKAPLWQKRLFLASYFGAELQTPRPFMIRNHNFPCPLLTVQKVKQYSASGRRFLEQVGALSEEFGAKVIGIQERDETTLRKHGISSRLRLLFSSRPEHLKALYRRIGFEYNRQRRFEAACVAAYQELKMASRDARELVMSEVKKLRAELGAGPKAIACKLEEQGMLAQGQVNFRFIERTVYEESDRNVRVPEGFPSYGEFRREATTGLGSSGLVWDEISEIRACEIPPWVYDLTVRHESHNFIANGFVVHNCGVRLLRTNFTLEAAKPKMPELIAALFERIPCGVGQSGALKIAQPERAKVVTGGAGWAVEHGYGVPEDLKHTEGGGCLEGADPSAVSERAYKRGTDQLGTLGSGNHFLEVQAVDQVFDPEAADRFGLSEGMITVMIHSGSRGFGYQVCDDFLEEMRRSLAKYHIRVPDIQLACAPVHSPEGKRYVGAMRAAANYAWANRQCLMHLAREVFEGVFKTGWRKLEMNLIYDVAHNIAKFETYKVNGAEKTLCIHRKGATRAFGPGHPELAEDYRDLGQPVIIPGDMGRNSYLLLGTAKAMDESFGSACHGAGRIMSRSEASRTSRGRSIEKELAAKGVIVMGRSMKGIAEEQPAAYKDVNEVVNVVHGAGLARRVVRMKPLGVIKG